MRGRGVSLGLLLLVLVGALPAWSQEPPETRVRTLVAALADSDPVRSGEAAFELKGLSDARSVPALVQALRTTSGETRRTVLLALGQFKDWRKIDALLDLLHFNQHYDREPADQLAALGDIGYRAILRYVDGCSADAGRSETGADALASFDGAVVLQRVVAMLRHRQPCRRRMAALALKYVGDEDTAIRVLEAVTEDRDAVLAEAAREALAYRSDPYGTSGVQEPDAVPDEIRAQLEGDDPADRLLGLEWLTDTPVTAATPLVAGLVSDADETVRLTAVSTLIAINARSTSGRDERERDPDGARQALLEALEDPVPLVRVAAAGGLAEIDNGAAWASVVDALIARVSDADARVRAEALLSLGRLGGPTALRDPSTADAVVSLLRDPDEGVRRQAASAAALILDGSHTRHTPALTAALDDPATRNGAIWALKKLGDPRAVQALARLIGVPGDPSCSVCAALGEIGDPSAVAVLLEAARHPWESVREGAVRELAKRADPRARQVFELSLRDPEVDVRIAAVRGLAALKVEGAVDALLPSLVDTSELVRRDVARVLGALGDPRAVPALIRVLPQMVPDAAAALAAIRDRTAVDPLLATLPTVQPWYQANIVHALGRIGDARALEPLITLLRARPEPRESGLEAAVVEALAALGDPRAAAALRERLSRLPPSGYHPLREPLVKAIERLGTPRPERN